jgi:hypothetical protein
MTFFFEKPLKSTLYDKEIISKNINKLTLYTTKKQGTYFLHV